MDRPGARALGVPGLRPDSAGEVDRRRDSGESLAGARRTQAHAFDLARRRPRRRVPQLRRGQRDSGLPPQERGARRLLRRGIRGSRRASANPRAPRSARPPGVFLHPGGERSSPPRDGGGHRSERTPRDRAPRMDSRRPRGPRRPRPRRNGCSRSRSITSPRSSAEGPAGFARPPGRSAGIRSP